MDGFYFWWCGWPDFIVPWFGDCCFCGLVVGNLMVVLVEWHIVDGRRGWCRWSGFFFIFLVLMVDNGLVDAVVSGMYGAAVLGLW